MVGTGNFTFFRSGPKRRKLPPRAHKPRPDLQELLAQQYNIIVYLYFLRLCEIILFLLITLLFTLYHGLRKVQRYFDLFKHI
jgi:hypothetical protein